MEGSFNPQLRPNGQVKNFKLMLYIFLFKCLDIFRIKFSIPHSYLLNFLIEHNPSNFDGS